MKRCVLTTRSVDQAGRMLGLLRSAGLSARNLPLLTFDRRPLSVKGPPPDWLIALTPAALKHGWPQLSGPWQRQPSLAAVGPGTLERLSQLAGRRVAGPRQRGGSDALLPLLPKNLAGQHVALLGTEVLSPGLSEALRQRGARVSGLCCAHSRALLPSAPRVATLLRRYDQLVTCLMSERALQALECLQSNCLHELKQQPVFVISERLADVARATSWQHIVVAPQATLDRLCQHIVSWHQQHLEQTAR